MLLDETADIVRDEEEKEKLHKPKLVTLNEPVRWSNGEKRRESDGSQFVTEDDHRLWKILGSKFVDCKFVMRWQPAGTGNRSDS